MRRGGALLCALLMLVSTLAFAAKEEASPLSPADIEHLNALERQWAGRLDAAVAALRVKQYRAAERYTDKAIETVGEMKAFLEKRDLAPDSIDQIVAMERLNAAYANMVEIGATATDPRATVADLSRIGRLFGDSRRKLTEAERRFHAAPRLQALCRQFLDVLDEFDREVKRMLSKHR